MGELRLGLEQRGSSHTVQNSLKRSLQAKGILLGLLLFLMAIASTAVVYSLRTSQSEKAAESE
jgi:hypothetical protein